MKCEPLEEDPFSFEGPEIIKCKGCLIDWKKGKHDKIIYRISVNVCKLNFK